jgi:hypothetical protein
MFRVCSSRDWRSSPRGQQAIRSPIELSAYQY